jgi:NhaA family Na+:H+ antiporter
MDQRQRYPISVFRDFLEGEASGGTILMIAAGLALVVANSPIAATYFATLHLELGPLSALHWVNDALMAFFFLLVGLEIKREALDGQLATWPRRVLPGIAALGGMVVPAVIYAVINRTNGEAIRGWAIPSATDIAFAVSVLSLLGRRIPASLKVFLTALAIIDDLGAVLIIALFYTSGLSFPDLAMAALILLALFALNRLGIVALLPYILLGVPLWIFVFRSGIHSTLAGVALAMMIPLRAKAGGTDDLRGSPLHRMEHSLGFVVPFVIVPLFGFANAGVSFEGMTLPGLLQPLTVGVSVGLVAGKLIGVFGSAWLAIKFGLAELPQNASWVQLFGVALLCDIGFTMSLFIGLLAFADSPSLQSDVKFGIIGGSVVAALLGAGLLSLSNSLKAER